MNGPGLPRAQDPSTFLPEGLTHTVQFNVVRHEQHASVRALEQIDQGEFVGSFGRQLIKDSGRQTSHQLIVVDDHGYGIQSTCAVLFYFLRFSACVQIFTDDKIFLAHAIVRILWIFSPRLCASYIFNVGSLKDSIQDPHLRSRDTRDDLCRPNKPPSVRTGCLGRLDRALEFPTAYPV